MMPQPMPQDDDKQEMDTIKQALMKIIGDMDKMDADSFLPDHMKPKMAAVSVSATPSPDDSDMPQDDDSDESNDPSMLAGLMDKAGSADADGSLPEDHQDDVDPSIAAIVAQKKKQLPQ